MMNVVKTEDTLVESKMLGMEKCGSQREERRLKGQEIRE